MGKGLCALLKSWSQYKIVIIFIACFWVGVSKKRLYVWL